MGKKSSERWQQHLKYNRNGIRILDSYEERVRRELRTRVLRNTGGRCAYCGVEISFREMSATLDHVIPLSRQDEYEQGLDDETNLVAACADCNSEKANRDLEEYRRFKTEKTGKPVVFFIETIVSG